MREKKNNPNGEKRGWRKESCQKLEFFSMEINDVLHGVLDGKSTSRTDISTNKAEID